MAGVHHYSGRFITFEGPEGGGKSTQLQLLADYLRQQGHPVTATREPGGTPIGREIRRVVHDITLTDMHPLAEILLYAADRAQHVAQRILPALQAGHLVLCDRFADSTYAYQGYGHGLSLSQLQQITAFATQGLTPQLTIYLDVPVKVGLARKQQANAAGDGEWNRMDQLTLAFHERVYAGYQTLIAAEPARWRVIRADAEPETVHQQVRAAVAAFLHA